MPKTNDSTSDDKRAPLRALFGCVAGGGEAYRQIDEYLGAVSQFTYEEVKAACEITRDTWENTFAAPQPGHIANACRRFAAKSRSDIRYEQERQRMDFAKRNRMTPARVRAELARVADIPLPGDEIPFKIEMSRREGLQRMLDRWDGQDVPPRVGLNRKRGSGGLNPIGDFVGEI